METAKRACGILVLLVCLIVARQANAGQSGVEVLAKLRQFDSALLNDVSFEVEVISPLTKRMPDTERLKRTITVTAKDGTWAYWARIAGDMKSPSYRAATDATRGEYGRGGLMYVSRPYEQRGLYEDGFLGVYTLRKRFDIRPDGSTSVRGPNRMVDLRSGARAFELHDVYIPFLSSGHGFSVLIDHIGKVTEKDSGQLHCEGVGRYTDGTPSRWEVTVDPQSGYMVREAKCARKDNGYVLAVMVNEGVQWGDIGPLPEKARFTFAPKKYGDSPNGSFEIVYTKPFGKANSGVLASARGVLRGQFATGTMILDWRGNPESPLQYVVGEVPVAEEHLREMLLPTAPPAKALPDSDRQKETRDGTNGTVSEKGPINLPMKVREGPFLYVVAFALSGLLACAIGVAIRASSKRGTT